MSKRYKVLCGVPKEHCTGGFLNTDQALSGKCHDGHDEAFKCKRRYLVHTLGYKQIGGREFSPPDDGPVLVLTKKIRFGARLRTGKEGRFMPNDDIGSRGVIL